MRARTGLSDQLILGWTNVFTMFRIECLFLSGGRMLLGELLTQFSDSELYELAKNRAIYNFFYFNFFLLGISLVIEI
jgi:hypothetical protein